MTEYIVRLLHPDGHKGADLLVEADSEEAAIVEAKLQASIDGSSGFTEVGGVIDLEAESR